MIDNWVYLSIFAILGLLCINTVSFILIFLHELAHALPAIYYTKRNVTIYIGSYSEFEGWKFVIGKLTIKVKLRLSYLRAEGFCRFEPLPSTLENAIILFAGPAGTLLIASLLYPFLIDTSVHGALKLIIVVFFALALLSLISNLYPRKLERDSTLYSDGLQILTLLKLRGANKNLFKAASLFHNDEFEKTLAELDQIDKKYLNEYICSLYIQSYVELKQFELLTTFTNRYLTATLKQSLTSYNCVNLSFAHIQLKEYNEALELLTRAIELNEDYYALNNRGFVYNLLGNYNAACDDLNKAIEIDPASAYAVTNRAYANVKLGLLDEALADINKSMELNDGNSYVYLVQGMYLLETGDASAALHNFETAKKLNPTTVLVDEYITLAIEKTTKV
ncbi:hypothetical protein A0256_18775 [Mucilaginibacter sp. PAMC 26640]|nr:hypothetical protein A0256_18775 [Mucilaginibacter sp. PAMC 26640]